MGRMAREWWARRGSNPHAAHAAPAPKAGASAIPPLARREDTRGVSDEGADRWKAMNEPLIAEFRASGGKLKRRNPGAPAHDEGARSAAETDDPAQLQPRRRPPRRDRVCRRRAASSRLVPQPRRRPRGPDRTRRRRRSRRAPSSRPSQSGRACTTNRSPGWRSSMAIDGRVRSREIPVVVFERLEPAR